MLSGVGVIIKIIDRVLSKCLVWLVRNRFTAICYTLSLVCIIHTGWPISKPFGYGWSLSVVHGYANLCLPRPLPIGWFLGPLVYKRWIWFYALSYLRWFYLSTNRVYDCIERFAFCSSLVQVHRNCFRLNTRLNCRVHPCSIYLELVWQLSLDDFLRQICSKRELKLFAQHSGTFYVNMKYGISEEII